MFAVLLSLLLTGAPSAAAPDDGEPSPAAVRPRVAFDAAIDLVARTPSDLVRDRAAATRRALDRRLTGTVSQPQILLQPGMRVLPGDRRSFAMQATVMQSWNVAGLGRARKLAARQETRAFAAQTRARRLSQRLAAARAWIDLHAIERQLELARHEAGMAQTMVERTQVAFDGGVLGRAELAQAKAYAAGAAARVLELEGRAHALGLVLARETASDPWVPLATAGAAPQPVLPAEPELARQFAAVDRLPPARARALASAAAKARAVEHARAARGTQLTVGAQLDRDDPDGLLAYGIVGVSFAGRGAGGRAKGDAVLERAGLEAEDLDETRALSTGLADVLHELEHSRAVLEQLDGALLPELAGTLDALLRQREAGEATVFEVLAARRRLADAQIDRAGAEAAVTWAEVHAWLLLAAMVEEPST